MTTSNTTAPPQLAFLTVVGTEKSGYVGGLLVLNSFGRPLEFHCTAPVRPNRAQEILYGNTLAPFLCGEQIAPALLARVTSPLLALVTDTPAVLASQLLTVPCLLLLNESDVQVSGAQESGAADLPGSPIPFVPGLNPDCFSIVTRGKRCLAMPVEFASKKNTVTAFDEFLFSIDPAEPFERIRLAIEEAQRGTQGTVS